MALASPTRASVEDPRAGSEVQKAEAPALPSTDSRENNSGVVQKRKYRRHPKVCCASDSCDRYFVRQSMTHLPSQTPTPFPITAYLCLSTMTVVGIVG